MKTSLYTLVLAAFIGMTSCSKRAQHAAEYNDSIVTLQTSIINALDLLDSTLNDSLRPTERVDYAHMNLQTTVKRGLLALDSIGSFEKDPSLELAAKDLFRVYENMATVEYDRLKKILMTNPELVTQEMADSSMSIQKRIHEQSQNAQDRFLKVQEEFGKKYHLEFEE